VLALEEIIADIADNERKRAPGFTFTRSTRSFKCRADRKGAGEGESGRAFALVVRDIRNDLFEREHGITCRCLRDCRLLSHSRPPNCDFLVRRPLVHTVPRWGHGARFGHHPDSRGECTAACAVPLVCRKRSLRSRLTWIALHLSGRASETEHHDQRAGAVGKGAEGGADRNSSRRQRSRKNSSLRLTCLRSSFLAGDIARQHRRIQEHPTVL